MKNRRILMFIEVNLANPNGDPEDGSPRQLPDKRGIITDECLKHKVRVQLSRRGVDVLHLDDGSSVRKKLNATPHGNNDVEKALSYLDIRLFGATDLKGAVNLKIPGTITTTGAVSVDPVRLILLPVNKSYLVDGEKKGSGYALGEEGQQIVFYGLYACYWGLDYYLAKDSGLTDADVDEFVSVLPHVFDDDASTLRPMGSMRVLKVITWEWEGNSGNGPSDKKLMDSVCFKKLKEYPSSLKDYKFDDSLFEKLELGKLCRMKTVFDDCYYEDWE